MSPSSWGVCKELVGPRLVEMLEEGGGVQAKCLCRPPYPLAGLPDWVRRDSSREQWNPQQPH